MENLNRLSYFVAIVEEGSITAAANHLRISKAVVSKQLQQLEDELGATLIIRNSRHMSLTETGERFFVAARASVAQAHEAFEIVNQGRKVPSGRLRIAAPMDFGTTHVTPAAAEFQQQFPAVHVDLNLSDTKFDPVAAKFDIAFRVGWPRDSANKARKLGVFDQYVVAARDLFDETQQPMTPSDLVSLPFVENRALNTPARWMFHDDQNVPFEIDLSPSFSVDTSPGVRAAVCAGAGIGILPDFVVQDDIRNGRLIRLLPTHSLRQGGIYALFPPSPYRSEATKKFAEFFLDRFVAQGRLRRQ